MALLKNWKIIMAGWALLASISAYLVFQNNLNLRDTLRLREEQLSSLIDARKKDALAAKQLVEALSVERDKLRSQEQYLMEISDENGVLYLNRAVPDSIKQLLNQ